MAGKPLTGVRVLEFGALGPGPFAGQLLADMGADVVLVDRPQRGGVGLEHAVERRGKRSIVLDLKSAAGRGLALELAGRVDMLIEGNRPGVMERLGLGPEDVAAVNPRLVYGRMTGWGQTGPYARMAGHDLNYIALTGALAAMGPAEGPPMPPLNLLGDFGGGSMFLIMGLLAGYIEAQRTGRGRVVDAAIVDGVNTMMGTVHSRDAAERWGPEREANMLDGGVPYYRCYRAACGGWVSVAAIEPQFHAALLRLLEIDVAEYGCQHDKALHSGQSARLEAAFATRSRDDWAGLFDGSDACVVPVLHYQEAGGHPQNAARAAYTEREGLTQPRPAPVFNGDFEDHAAPVAVPDSAREALMAELGYDTAGIEALAGAGAFGAAR